jgi:predicted TIM-barrel fold metal-dependent hydrolase
LSNRIDVHHHIIPPDYGKLLQRRGLTPGGVPLPDWSVEKSLKLMDSTDIATAILSVSTPGVWFGDSRETRRWARHVNEFSAAVVAQYPARFGFFATLTLPDVDTAITEADHALDVLDADGVVLLANTSGRYLGDPAFDRLLAHLNERRAVVFIHPGELPAPAVPGIPAFTADFLLDTTRTAISLILSGAMDRYTGFKFILSHAGGFLPYISYRVLLTMLRDKSKVELAALALRQEHEVPKLLAPIRRFYFDIALSSTPTAFPSLMSIAESDRVLYGSDFPFAPANAVKFMAKQYEKYNFSSAQRASIDHANAETLFPRLCTSTTATAGGNPRLWWRRS